MSSTSAQCFCMLLIDEQLINNNYGIYQQLWLDCCSHPEVNQDVKESTLKLFDKGVYSCIIYKTL